MDDAALEGDTHSEYMQLDRREARSGVENLSLAEQDRLKAAEATVRARTLAR